MAELLTDPQTWISLLTLSLLEIVLGIDNIVFISILAGKLPADQQKKARQLGLGLALITRVLLLLSTNRNVVYGSRTRNFWTRYYLADWWFVLAG